MKKTRYLSLLLCTVLLMQCVLMPASAVETTEETVATQPAEVPFGSVSIQEGCRTIEGMRPLAGSDRKLDTSQAAFAFEVNTGTVIYSYNPDLKLSPGALTKMVLALVVIESCDLEEIVTCADGIQSKVPGTAVHVKPNLKSGEQLTVEDLLHCVMLNGANDAAVALAEHVAGTTTAFLALMNQRVKMMGCTSTEFGNISGLDTATSYSTARDLTKIVIEATKNETFATIFGTAEYTVPATNMVESERELLTSNYLIDNHNILQFMNSRVKGGMASNTDLSGASIACVAEYNNMRVILVTLGALRVMNEETGITETYGNFEEVTELMNYVFNTFKPNRIIYDGMTVNQWPVVGGESEAVGQAYVDIDSIVPAGVQMKNLITEYTVDGGSLTAPIKKNERIATVEFWYNNSCVAEAELFAMSDVKATDSTGVTIRSTAAISDSDASNIMSVIGTICVIILGIVGLYLVYNSYMRSRIRAQRRKRRAARRRSR